MLSEPVRHSEVGTSQASGGQQGPDLFTTNQIDGMPMLESPKLDSFWYTLLDPLPIDIDFSSIQPLY